MQSPFRNLLLALGLSALLHALGLFALERMLKASTAKPAARTVLITARLEIPAPRPDAAPQDDLLKNTLEPTPHSRQTAAQRAPANAEAPAPAPPRARTQTAERLTEEQLDRTLERLSDTLLYPPEAVRRGIEGETVLMLELGAGGRVLQATVASSSGHAILDDAAVRAALQLGSLGAPLAGKAILLPVRFRLM